MLSLLTSGRSLNAVKDALQKMAFSTGLEVITNGLIEELDLRNSRTLDPDLLAMYVDGKYVEFREGDRLRPACIYVVIGLKRDEKNKSLPVCRAPAGKISRIGSSFSAT